MTCITPRAFAEDTIELLNPLSCQAIAAASEGETPCSAATDWTSEAPTVVAVGSGAASGTTVCAGSGVAAWGGAGAPLGSLSTVPTSSGAAGSMPFMAAIASTETPEEDARAPSVSPGRTLYEPWG